MRLKLGFWFVLDKLFAGDIYVFTTKKRVNTNYNPQSVPENNNSKHIRNTAIRTECNKNKNSTKLIFFRF